VGIIQTDTDSATIPFSYPGDDITGIEYSFNYGARQAATNPVEVSQLSEGTNYTIQFWPINDQGDGTETIKGLRTKTTPTPPGPDDWPFSKGIRYSVTTNWTWGRAIPKPACE